jgi:membrane protein YqaA with SNARE-associated domain
MEQIQDYVQNLDPILQWLAILILGAIPYIESYFGSVIGVIAGVPVILAIVFAIIGNIISMVLLVLFGKQIRKWRKSDEKPLTPRKQKMKAIFDKYGVIGVSLLGQTLLPSQLTAMAMVTFGASRKKVILWQIISIIIWGVAFGVLAHLGINVLLR